VIENPQEVSNTSLSLIVLLLSHGVLLLQPRMQFKLSNSELAFIKTLLQTTVLTHPGGLFWTDVVYGRVGGHHAGDGWGGVGHAYAVGQAARGYGYCRKQLQQIQYLTTGPVQRVIVGQAARGYGYCRKQLQQIQYLRTGPVQHVIVGQQHVDMDTAAYCCHQYSILEQGLFNMLSWDSST
jgi:hypothetical protein